MKENIMDTYIPVNVRSQYTPETLWKWVSSFECISRVVTHTESETERFGEKFGRTLEPGDVAAITGELGSGKTCLIRGICRGLGVKERVSSPTFILVHEYRGRVPVYHTDMYRIRKIEDLKELGISDITSGDGVVLIEWADRVPGIVPENAVSIHMSIIDENTRKLEFLDGRKAI